MSRLIGFVTCGFEEVVAFFVREQIADVSDRVPELIVGSGGGFPEQRLELGECHFDWIEVWAVRRQEQKPCTDVVQGAGGTGAFMTGQVVKNDNIASTQRRHQLGCDVEIEHLRVHSPVEDPGCVHPVMAQRSDKGLGAPVAEGRMIDQALPAWGPAGGLGHVGLDRGFVNEGQPFQMVGHEGLAFGDPDTAQVSDIPALLLKRLQVFFCVTARAEATAAQPKSDAPAARGRRPVLPSIHQA